MGRVPGSSSIRCSVALISPRRPLVHIDECVASISLMRFRKSSSSRCDKSIVDCQSVAGSFPFSLTNGSGVSSPNPFVFVRVVASTSGRFKTFARASPPSRLSGTIPNGERTAYAIVAPFGNSRSFFVKFDTMIENVSLGPTSTTPLAMRSPCRNCTDAFGSRNTSPVASVVTLTVRCDIAGTRVYFVRRTENVRLGRFAAALRSRRFGGSTFGFVSSPSSYGVVVSPSAIMGIVSPRWRSIVCARQRIASTCFDMNDVPIMTGTASVLATKNFTRNSEFPSLTRSRMAPSIGKRRPLASPSFGSSSSRRQRSTQS